MTSGLNAGLPISNTSGPNVTSFKRLSKSDYTSYNQGCPGPF